MNLTFNSKTAESEGIQKMVIDGISIFYVENVKDFSFIERDDFSYKIEKFSSPPSESPVYYFNVELQSDIAFAHFCFESVIYFPYFLFLKGKIPGLKLLIKRPRVYKDLFCKIFGINDIVNSIDTNHSNIVFFPNPDTALNDKNLSEHWMKLVLGLFSFFQDLQLPPLTQKEVIILPRQTKENCVCNDRKFPLSDIIEYAKDKNAYVLHTDEITDLKDQIKLLKSSNKIILTDGSPFLVNGLFIQEKNIFIIDTLTEYQSQRWPKYNFIIQCIKKINKNSIHYFENEQKCLDFIKSQPTFFDLLE